MEIEKQKDGSRAIACHRVPVASPGDARLLDLNAAAGYLGLSYWTVRDYVLQGLIPVVLLPPLRGREGESPKRNLRRVLVDRAELDAFVERCKS